MDTKLEVYLVTFYVDTQETSASCEDLKNESVTEFTAEANHITSSLRSLIAIQVIGFCWSYPMTETPTLESMKKQLYALLLNC